MAGALLKDGHIVADIGAWHDAGAAGQTCHHVGHNVAVQIWGDHHVKLVRLPCTQQSAGISRTQTCRPVCDYVYKETQGEKEWMALYGGLSQLSSSLNQGA